MTDRQVENTLNAIRARALVAPVSEHETQSAAAAAVPAHAAPVQRLAMHLSRAASLRDQLPPLTSKRRGGIARLELFLKTLLKRATHWFTWGQVGYNAAIHAAMQESMAAAVAHEQRVEDLREEILSEVRAETAVLINAQAAQMLRSESLLGVIDQLEAEIAALKTKVARLTTESGSLTAALSSVASGYEKSLREVASGQEQAAAEIAARLAQAREADARRDMEQRALIAHLLEEQRILFKQLSLEGGEQAALADRAQRRAESEIRDLSDRLNALHDERRATGVGESLTR